MDISEEFKENINDVISLILETIKEKFDTQKKKSLIIEVWITLNFKSLLLQIRIISLSRKNCNYRQILKVLNKYSFPIERQSGSHIQLKHSDGNRLTVSRHDLS